MENKHENTIAHERAKENAVQQARGWAQEARTQKSIVKAIGAMVGCDNDWEVESHVKGVLIYLNATAQHKHTFAARPVEICPECGGIDTHREGCPEVVQRVDPWAPSGKEYDRSIHSCADADAVKWAEFFMQTYPNCGAESNEDVMDKTPSTTTEENEKLKAQVADLQERLVRRLKQVQQLQGRLARRRTQVQQLIADVVNRDD